MLVAHGWRGLPLVGVNLQDPPTRLLRRHREEELAIESSGAAEGRVDGVDSVGGADDDHAAPGLQPVLCWQSTALIESRAIKAKWRCA